MFTNSTTNYGLPQWIATDKPAWIADMNPAFSKIDEEVKNANDVSSGALNTVTALQGRVKTNEENITTIQSEVSEQANAIASTEENVTELTNNITAMQTNITALQKVSNEEVVNVNALSWVSSSVDARYPYQSTVSVVKAHSKPQAYPYKDGGLISANEYAVLDTIEQMIYDTEAQTITFYSTMPSIDGIADVSLVVEG